MVLSLQGYKRVLWARDTSDRPWWPLGPHQVYGGCAAHHLRLSDVDSSDLVPCSSNIGMVRVVFDW